MKGQNHSIDFQERDFAILCEFLASRVMTLAHVAHLHFKGKTEACKKRLQKFKAAGLIAERPRRPYEPAVLHLTRSGFNLLVRDRKDLLGPYPSLSPAAFDKRANVSKFTLAHELDVMSVKVAVFNSLSQKSGFSVAEFSTWPALMQFQARRPAANGYAGSEMIVKPDGFIRIEETDSARVFEHTFYLEVDRSTETQDTLALKATCYLDHYRTGGLAVRYGQPASSYKDYPFRVLMVFKNDERRNNAALRMLQNNPPILTMVWLTTFAELLDDPFGAIWIRPVDYRDATKGTSFDSAKQPSKTYRRQQERERWVEQHTTKHHLIAEDMSNRKDDC